MATHAELVELLRGRSYVNGWTAVGVFDGRVIGPMLSDYYAPIVHGFEGVRPLPPDSIELTPTGEYIARIDQIVMAAPRLSFLSGTLQDSRVRVIFDLHAGIYSEATSRAGAPDLVTRYTNLAAAPGHTFSFDLDLAEAEGRIDEDGTSWLTLGGARSPDCTLGSSRLANETVAERLLEMLSNRSRLPVQLPLGNLIHKRRWLRPTGFQLRVQALAGMEEAHALVVFISGVAGQEGIIPDQASFAYLLPQDRDAAGRGYSATLLVAREHQALQEGEAQALYGQTLFPSERNFTVMSEHNETKDIVLFGRLEPLVGGAASKPSRNQPGVTAHLQTLTLGALPVNLSASQSVSEGWSWSMSIPDLGSLDPQPGTANAVYTRPETLPNNAPVALQRVIAIHPATGQRIETCFVIQGYAPTTALSSALFANAPPNVPFGVTATYDPSLPVAFAWEVLGRGTISGTSATGSYRTPSEPGDDIDLILCQVLIDLGGGTLRPFSTGYSIVQLVPSAGYADQWTRPTPFTLKAKTQNARVFANGLQQFEIEVEVGTGSNQGDITDAEFATLRLAVRGGADIALIPRTVEGLVRNADGILPKWGYTLQRNGFKLANTAVLVPLPQEAPSKALVELAAWAKDPSQAFAPQVRDASIGNVGRLRGAPYSAPNAAGSLAIEGPRGAVRRQTFYLQTHSTTPETFIVKITAADNSVYASDDDGQGQGADRTLEVIPREPLEWQQDLERIPRKRVVGGYVDKSIPPDLQYTVDFPNYDWYLTTCDYWTLRHELPSIPSLPIPIVRLEWAADLMQVKWESEQNNEDLFSYLGFALIESANTPNALDFASVLFDPLLYNRTEATVQPRFQVIDRVHAPSPGQVLISVNRVTNIFYRQRKKIADENNDVFPFENQGVLTLWDEFGNKMRLLIGFETTNRNKIIARRI